MYATVFSVERDDGTHYDLDVKPLLVKNHKDDSLAKGRVTPAEDHNLHLLIGHYVIKATETEDARYTSVDGVRTHAAMAEVVLCHTYGWRSKDAIAARRSKVIAAVLRITKALYGHIDVDRTRGPNLQRAKVIAEMERMKDQFRSDVLASVDYDKIAEMVAEKLKASAS